MAIRIPIHQPVPATHLPAHEHAARRRRAVPSPVIPARRRNVPKTTAKKRAV